MASRRAGTNNAASIAMIAITTRSSISVNPARFIRISFTRPRHNPPRIHARMEGPALKFPHHKNSTGSRLRVQRHFPIGLYAKNPTFHGLSNHGGWGSLSGPAKPLESAVPAVRPCP